MKAEQKETIMNAWECMVHTRTTLTDLMSNEEYNEKEIAFEIGKLVQMIGVRFTELHNVYHEIERLDNEKAQE